MANTQLLDTPWLDILPPPAPTDHNLLVALCVIGLVALLTIGVVYLWQRRPRQHALRQLRQLQQHMNSQHLDNRQCLFEVNRLLRNGLGKNQLPCLDDDDWQAFYHRLITLQYRASAPATDDTRQLLQEASTLLRRFKA